MFKFIKFWTKSKNVNSPRYKKDLASHLDGRALKYVTERKNDVDEVIGRSGAIIVREDELLVYADSTVLFRTKIENLQAWELLSAEGVVITAPDIENGDVERTIIAYYTYWRK